MGLAAGAGLVALLMVLPLLHLGVRASEAKGPWALLTSSRVLAFTSATLRLGLATMAATLVLGVGLAWLVERTDLPGRRVLGLLATLPLVVPTYVGAVALLAAFGARGVLVELEWITGFWGALVALTLSTFPYVLLPVRAALTGLDPAIEEAARALGDRPARAFFRAVLPQLRKAIAGGGLLVFLYVLSDFGAVSMLRYDTLTRGIFLEYRSSFDRAPAAVLGVLLVALAGVAVAAERRLRGSTPPVRNTGAIALPPTVALGRWRWPAALAVVLVALAGVGLPIGTLLWWAAEGASEGGFGSRLVSAAGTSAAVSGAAALAAVAVAAPVAYLAVRFRSHYSRAVESVAVVGFALPGLVVGLALVFFTSRYAGWLYQTSTLLVVAYVIRFLPEALSPARSSLALVDRSVEDAARSLGRSRLAAVATVTAPLVRPGLVAGAALVFLTAMKELPATLLLRPAGVDTLAVRVWTGASEGFYAQAAPAALLLILVSGLALLPITRAGERV